MLGFSLKDEIFGKSSNHRITVHRPGNVAIRFGSPWRGRRIALKSEQPCLDPLAGGSVGAACLIVPVDNPEEVIAGVLTHSRS